MTSLRAPGFDSTRSFLRCPYTFIGRTCERLGSDVFETRLWLQRTICLRGEEAAALFDDDERFERRGVAPGWLARPVLGRGSVQDFNGVAHLARKTLRLSQFDTASLTHARRLFAEEWAVAVPWWELEGKVVLGDELKLVLTRVACAWTGVPLPETEVQIRADDFRMLFDAEASAHPLETRRARRRVETWLGGLLRTVRAGGSVEPHSALERLARSKLDEATALAELCHLIRPVLALSGYIVFLALALHQYPHLTPTNREERLHFIQEVRRHYPSIPVAVARVRRDFEWQGTRFHAGQRAFLDVFGTNHHPLTWVRPNAFQPDRFAGTGPRSHALVSQTANERGPHDRWAGEELSLAILDEAMLQLTVFTHYRVRPSQDLGLEMRRVPALPRSRLILEDVRARAFVEPLGRQLREESLVTPRSRRKVG